MTAAGPGDGRIGQWVRVTSPAGGAVHAGYLVEHTPERIVVRTADGALRALPPSYTVEAVPAPRNLETPPAAPCAPRSDPPGPVPVSPATRKRRNAPAATGGTDGDGELPEGEWLAISFMGHIEYHGAYVRQITRHGQPAYRIEPPEYVWGGDPYAVRYHAASAWFADYPVREESVRQAWERDQAAAAERRQRDEELIRRGTVRALPAGESGNFGAGPWTDEQDEYAGVPF